MGLRFTNINVPAVVDFRDPIKLSCGYDMGYRKLNSVKWYKDDKEFFRYSPMTSPPVIQFRVDGVTEIDDNMYSCDYQACSIKLDNLDKKSSGSYRCEISGDTPDFKVISHTGSVIVAALPQIDPIINGLSSSYKYDDFVTANCTTDRSSPPPTIYWYINNETVSPDYLEVQTDTPLNVSGYLLQMQSSELRFRIDRARFYVPGGGTIPITIKCLAKIDRFSLANWSSTAHIYVRSRDDSLSSQKLTNSRGYSGSQSTFNYTRFSYAQFVINIISLSLIVQIIINERLNLFIR